MYSSVSCDEERPLFLGGGENETSQDAPTPRWRWLLAAPVVVFFALLGTTVNEQAWASQGALGPAPASAPETDLMMVTDYSNKPGWYFYKVAYAAKADATDELLWFMGNFSMATTDTCAKVRLGCDGYKITCTFEEVDTQLHYVVADKFYSEVVDGDGLGVSGWIDIATKDFGDMEQWTPFMHEKVTVLLPKDRDPAVQATMLRSAGYPVMQRSSVNERGQPCAHVMVPVGGKIWEFVGEMTPKMAASGAFPPFADDECPQAHIISANLSLAAKHAGFWLGVQSGASDVESDSYKTHLKHLRDLANVHVEKRDSDACKVRELTLVNKEESSQSKMLGNAPITVKYVQNNLHQETKDGRTISEYESYVADVHKRFLVLRDTENMWNDRWHHWDHFLDTHIGIKFKNSTGCKDKAIQLNEYLLRDHIYVGKRSINMDGDHYYSGYPGVAMTMEYNTECHVFPNKSTDICACVHDNSDKLARELGLADEYCVDQKF